MANNGKTADVIWGLPWIAKLLIAIFADFVFGICRLVDGIVEKDVLKGVLGFLWIFYGLFIGWIADVVCVIIDKRPFFF